MEESCPCFYACDMTSIRLRSLLAIAATCVVLTACGPFPGRPLIYVPSPASPTEASTERIESPLLDHTHGSEVSPSAPAPDRVVQPLPDPATLSPGVEVALPGGTVAVVIEVEGQTGFLASPPTLDPADDTND